MSVSVQPRPCTACHELVYDLDHVRTQNPAPIDAKTDPSGNIAINVKEGFYTILKKEVIQTMTEEERGQLHTSHFATCRYANRFRREVRNAADSGSPRDRRFMA